MRLLLLMAGLLITLGANSTCLKIEDITTLTGALVTKVYSGPEDVPKPITRFVLELDKPLDCVVDVDDTFPEWNKDVTVLPATDEMVQELRLYKKQHVSVLGTVTLAATAYEFTAVVLIMDKIEPFSQRHSKE